MPETTRRIPRWRALLKFDNQYRLHEFPAWTKSEARAAAKQTLGIARKGRLPAGVEFSRF